MDSSTPEFNFSVSEFQRAGLLHATHEVSHDAGSSVGQATAQQNPGCLLEQDNSPDTVLSNSVIQTIADEIYEAQQQLHDSSFDTSRKKQSNREHQKRFRARAKVSHCFLPLQRPAEMLMRIAHATSFEQHKGRFALVSGSRGSHAGSAC